MRTVRRGVVGLALALSVAAWAPLGAQAATLTVADNSDNQSVINAVHADQQWLISLPAPQQGVVLGQREIQNAQAIAQLLHYDTHAQTEVPNSLEQYRLFCETAIQHVQANLANARATATARPWDQHAQAELANADALSRAVWTMIGDSYPGNPYLVRPAEGPVYADDGADAVVAGDDAAVASDDGASADQGLDAAVADDTN